MKIKSLSSTMVSLFIGMALQAQTYQVPVSEVHEKMQTGKYQPTWESLRQHETPE